MIGARLPVQWDGHQVRLLHPETKQLLREHLVQPRGGYASREEDRPKKTPETTLVLLGRAMRAGKHTGELCQQLHREDPDRGVRRVLGVLSLVKKHGPVTVDEASRAAMEMGVPTYRFVRKYIERRLAPQLELRQIDPLIRTLTHYRDLIDRTTKEPK
jgi:hypothetical protein